jgi:hypothetical protein
MEKQNKTKTISILVGLLILFLINFASAASIGVSPASLEFKGILRQGYAERQIVLSTNSLDDVGIVIEPFGEIADWMSLEENEFIITYENPRPLILSISPPIDTPNGNYTGFARITSTPFGEVQEGMAVGNVRTYLDLLVNVEVTDREVIRCTLENYEIHSVEKGDDLVLEIDFLNRGNVRLKPKVSLDIWNFDQTNIILTKDFIESEVLPTKESRLELRIPTNDFEFGQYWMEVTLPDCYENKLTTFDVLEEGTLTAKGVLLGIANKKIANISETVPISAKFKNNGEKELESQFSGKITLGKEIIQIIDTPQAKVSVGEEHSFDFFFTPKKKGEYIISGRVIYNGKRTFESSSTLEVIGSDFSLKTVIFSIAYAIVIFLILIFIYRIIKEKRKYKQRLNKL